MKEYDIWFVYTTELDQVAKIVDRIETLIGGDRIVLDTSAMYPCVRVICTKKEWQKIRFMTGTCHEWTA